MQLRFIGIAIATTAALTIAACGGEVVTPMTEGTTTTGGTTSGGAAGTGGAGGSTAKSCGGKLGGTCAADEYCVFNPAGSCGAFDASGTCQPQPQGACPPDCPGVCGCDNNFYCSACEAAAAGTDVGGGSCFPDAGSGEPIYSAYTLATNVERFVIFRAEPALNRCVSLWVAKLGGSSPVGIDTSMGWIVEQAGISNDAADCALSGSGVPIVPAGPTQHAEGGSGSLKLDDLSFPCQVSLHAVLHFTPGVPWVPPSVALDADALKVEGGCF